MALVSPSVLAADFLQLQRDIDMVNNSEADYFHLDIMDGVFVPNISYGMPVMKAIQSAAQKPLDVHLMIVQPERYIQEFKALGAEILTIHYEVSPHLHRSVQAVKNAGMKAGVALNPHTPVQLLNDIIQDIDLVLIMSVNPGFGGQQFIEQTYNKIRETRELISSRNSKAVIEVDGGVNETNAQRLVDCGADILVAGSAVFSHPYPIEIIAELKNTH